MNETMTPIVVGALGIGPQRLGKETQEELRPSRHSAFKIGSNI